jgi:quaternary ammonium compound-resistance protein SugE
MAWICLLLAGVLEIVWAAAMKKSDGFTTLTPTVFAMRTLPLGTAYSIWTGIGAAGAFVFGVLFLDEALTPARALAAILIIAGIILMKVSSGH